MLGILLSVTSMVLLLVETGLQIYLALHRQDFTSFVLILSLVTGPLVIVNIISTVLVFRTMDFTGRGCARLICILLHFLQVGLLWRCLKLILLFDEHDWRDFIMLRLIHTALQSFPLVILKGSHYFSSSDMTIEVLILVVVSVISNGVVFSMFNTEKYLFENDEFSEFSVRIRKPFGVVLLTIGTIFLLFSRCGSIMLFLAIVPVWVTLPLGLHFLIHFFSTTIYHFCYKEGSILQILRNICFAYFNIFDILSKKNQKIICSNVFLYSGILVQNVIMTGYWMVNNDWDYRHQLGTVLFVILTFICGMFIKCCSCGYIQNEKFEPFSDATFQLALEIATKNTPEVIMINNKNQNEIQNHEQYGEYENHCSVISVENGYIHRVSQSNPRRECVNNTKNDKSRRHKSNEKGDSSQTRKRSKTISCSNADLASSNSRNTNTLNVSDPSNVFNQSEETLNNEKVGDLRSTQTLPSLTVRKRPDLTVRTSDRKPNAAKIVNNNSIEIKRSFCKSPPKNRKSPLPLFPNECSDFVSNKTFEAKHVLSNSVDEYNGSDTETSYSEYDSYSYYIDSTDWSTMSCDSACTWPPSNPMTFVNLHNLPKDTFSATDSVQIWLTKLDEWEPSIVNESFELTYNENCCSPVPSELTDRSCNSKYKNFSKEHQINTIHNPENRESDILLRPKDALLQFCNVQRDSTTPRYLPYNPSDYDKTRQLSSDNTIVIWHEADTTPSNTIQESMV